VTTGHARPGRPPGTRHIRCSNAERESVVDQLKQAYAEGRLDHEEFDQRVHLGMTAKTWGDLDAVLVGLAPRPRTAPYRPRRANAVARRLLIVAATVGSIIYALTWFVGGAVGAPSSHPPFPLHAPQPPQPPEPPPPPG
jgi:Domain of unknown function (DUF1707)